MPSKAKAADRRVGPLATDALQLPFSMHETVLAGVDEAGRGPLAGPVVAAAVILDPARPVAGVDDSKRLAPARRRRLAQQIQEQALAWALARSEVAEIDSLNILRASLLAMQRAVAALRVRPEWVVVDGNHCPAFACRGLALVRGDQRLAAVAAASILAKESRDREMLQLDALYPQYGFASHKGYPVVRHVQALARHGATPAHRRSFAPVRRVLT